MFFNGAIEQMQKSAVGGLSDRMQTLLAELESIEQKLPTTSGDEKATCMERLAEAMKRNLRRIFEPAR